jgi:hypothetical protein
MPKQGTFNQNEEMAVETRRVIANEIFDAAVESGAKS